MRLRALDGRLVGVLLDHEGRAVGLHEAAFREVDLVEETFDAGGQGNLLRRNDRADEFALRRDRSKLDRRRFDDRRGRGGLLLRERAMSREQKQTHDEKATTSD